jgi:hypothetical protein
LAWGDDHSFTLTAPGQEIVIFDGRDATRALIKVPADSKQPLLLRYLAAQANWFALVERHTAEDGSTAEIPLGGEITLRIGEKQFLLDWDGIAGTLDELKTSGAELSARNASADAAVPVPPLVPTAL